MRTGSLIFSPRPARKIQVENLLAFLQLFFEILGLFEYLDAGRIQPGQHVFEFGAARDVPGQNFTDLVVQDVALFLAHLYEPLQPLVFVF